MTKFWHAYKEKIMNDRLVSQYRSLAEQASEGDCSGALGAATALLQCLLDPPGTPELAESHARAFLIAMEEK